MKEMVETYVSNLTNYGGPEDPVLHQYILTCQLLRKFEHLGIFKSWSWLQEQMQIISQEPSPGMRNRSVACTPQCTPYTPGFSGLFPPSCGYRHRSNQSNFHGSALCKPCRISCSEENFHHSYSCTPTVTPIVASYCCAQPLGIRVFSQISTPRWTT